MYSYCKYCNSYYEDWHNCDKKRGKCYEKHDKSYKDTAPINVNVDCCCHNKKDDLVRESGFRAASATNMPLPPNFGTKVLFPIEEFDLANEYNAATSTFVAKTAGLYFFTASVQIQPNNPDVDFQIIIAFIKNGVLVSLDDEFKGRLGRLNPVVEVNDVLLLNAGDTIEVRALTTTPGLVIQGAPSTHFAAGRFSSQIK
ncbi:ABC transporter permease [Bacillus toyonensis]|uniref:C1q-like domain-containing protein n=1 Tax=Bacillus toyonensis TaxID=155322 RepID=UPI000BF0E3E4|nr:ABC transporter permease [Bacillus toyonensis]PEN77539.1 ABC transporter permease [Bacillus toyonensis]